MTTPERIWVQHDTKNHLAELSEMAVKPVDEVLGAFTEYVRADIHDALRAEVERLREALTPSADTKAAYEGEFKVGVTLRHPGLGEDHSSISVPWATIKEIMKAISTRANFPACQGGSESGCALKP